MVVDIAEHRRETEHAHPCRRRLSPGTVGPGLAAQAPEQPPSILIESLAGRDSFELYCASCHGATGRGDGPVAGALQKRPTDLTTVARRNGGAFPSNAVRGSITGTGRAVVAHGTAAMPVWGPLFRAFESDARTRLRIENLVAYIESIQVAVDAR